MFQNYLTIAFRNLMRNKGYSFINITGLSLGLAVAMLIVLYVKDELSYDRFHTQQPLLYRIVVNEQDPEGKVGKFAQTGMMPGPSFKAEIPEIQDFVRLEGELYNIKKGNDVLEQDALVVDSNFFKFFTFDFVDGNAKSAFKSPQSIVISEEVAEKYFGTSQAVGKKLSIFQDKAFKDFLISGVTKKSPQNSSIKINLLIPMHLTGKTDDQWINFYLNTFVLLSPNADIEAVEEKFAKVFASKAAKQLAEARRDWGYKHTVTYKLQPLLDMHLSTDYRATNGLKDDSNPMYSYILTGIAIFLLLIACINFINLTMARSLKRSKEIGIRKVVGGQRKQLIRQFLGESFLLSFVSFSLAILLVEISLPFFNTLANKALSFSYLVDAPLIIIYVVLFIVTGFLAGFYPALVLSGFNPVQTLYGRFQLSGKNLLQKSLVVVQFALATFLIVVTGVMFQQFTYLTTVDLGYNDKHLVELNTGRISRQTTETFKNELLKSPAIEAVAPQNGGSWFTVAKINNGKETAFACNVVDQDFLPALQIPVAEGRNFSVDFPSDSIRSVLVNETFAKEAGWKNPIGQKIDFFMHKHEYEVVGVVKDYHYESLAEKIKPQVFFTDAKMSDFGKLLIKIKPQQTVAGIKHIEAVFKQLVPTRPFDYQFKDLINAKQYEAEQKWKQIISLAALLTIFVSCIGLFGLATLSAEKRIKEIGVRKVMGASVQSITTMLSKDFLKLVLIASTIALPAAWFAIQKWLEAYPYRIEPSVWLFGGTVVFIALVALFTVGYQAIKAALANPVKSLRTE